MQQFFKKISLLHPAMKFVISCFFFLLLIGNWSLLIETGNWYQQFFPNLNGASIMGIQFTDSLTGYAAANFDSTNISYLLKTTNGGDNWVINLSDNASFTKLVFINSTTGFVGRGAISGNTQIIKTTNGGNNWTTINLPEDGFVNDMSVLSEDTIWVADPIGLVGGLYWSANGGANWQRIYGGTGNNPEKIYMVNARLGFMSRGGSPLNKTYDGGYNWTVLTGGSWSDIYFVDTLTGWKSGADMKKTTDGGLNWITQTLPNGGMIESQVMFSFSNINKDTIWGGGGLFRLPNNQTRRILYRTTNGGDTWYFQLPDTSIRLDFPFVNFIDKFKGWATSYNTDNYTDEIHTVTGGDTTFLLGLKQISNEIPKEFKLYQNYPNPFNPYTAISYELRVTSYVKLAIYDIAGKFILNLINQKQNPGKYQVDFSGYNYSSGIYFYSLIINSVLVDTKKMLLVK